MCRPEAASFSPSGHLPYPTPPSQLTLRCVSSSTASPTASGNTFYGIPIEVSSCLAAPPRLSHFCVHFPGSKEANRMEEPVLLATSRRRSGTMPLPKPMPGNRKYYSDDYASMGPGTTDVAACGSTGQIKFVEMERRRKPETDMRLVDDDADADEPHAVVQDGCTIAAWIWMPSSELLGG